MTHRDDLAARVAAAQDADSGDNDERAYRMPEVLALVTDLWAEVGELREEVQARGASAANIAGHLRKVERERDQAEQMANEYRLWGRRREQERDEARAEVAMTRAALATPEGYSGVVSAVLAEEVERLRAQNTALRAALTEALALAGDPADAASNVRGTATKEG